MNERDKFYSKVTEFWADMYGTEYALYDTYPVEAQDVSEIREATEKIGHIFFKTAELLRQLDNETLLELGYPKETLDFIRMVDGYKESLIARLDLIPFNGGYKCIEINADTPTFIKELFYVNQLVTKELNAKSPNEFEFLKLEKHIRSAVQHAKNELLLEDREPHIVFAAHKENEEDFYTAKYLSGFYEGSKVMDVQDLKLKYGVGLFDEEGKKIDILYRQTLPIENLILDKDEEGNPVGIWLLEMINKNKLKIINPPSAFLLQNKSVMGVIWGLYETKSSFFSSEEQGWIKEYFLPTYFEGDLFVQKQVPFVKKPVFGREGDTVEIFTSHGDSLLRSSERSYEHFPAIYQEYVPQPLTTFKNASGQAIEGNLLIGSFLIGGEASAFGFRVGPKITNNLSYYLPVRIK